MPTDQLEPTSPTALVYETTEEARLLLDTVDVELTQASVAASEAAYYLSDTLEPADRMSLVAFAESVYRPLPSGEDETCVIEALTLLADAAGEVEEMLRGPAASAELRTALRALRRAIGSLVGQIDLATDHLTINGLRSERLCTLRHRHTKRQ
jgi:hypothetical protein